MMLVAMPMACLETKLLLGAILPKNPRDILRLNPVSMSFLMLGGTVVLVMEAMSKPMTPGVEQVEISNMELFAVAKKIFIVFEFEGWDSGNHFEFFIYLCITDKYRECQGRERHWEREHR
eukprot:5184933-Ditylum_brightwellii.AAC.1